jgi:hypothetical protein
MHEEVFDPRKRVNAIPNDGFTPSQVDPFEEDSTTIMPRSTDDDP